MNEPGDEIDVGTWIFGLSNVDHRACTTGHHGVGTYAVEQSGVVNVKSVGGHTIDPAHRNRPRGCLSGGMCSATSAAHLFQPAPRHGRAEKLEVTLKSPRPRIFLQPLDHNLPSFAKG